MNPVPLSSPGSTSLPLQMPPDETGTREPAGLAHVAPPCRTVRERCLRLALRAARAAGAPGLSRLAATLEVSEGELVAAHAAAFDGSESPLRAQRLQPVWPAIVAALPAWGVACIASGSRSATLRVRGVHPGLALAAHWSAWAQGYVLTERQADGSARRSLHVYDAHGQRLHAVQLDPQAPPTAVAALQALVEHWGTTLGPGRFRDGGRDLPPSSAPACLQAAALPGWIDDLDADALPELLHRCVQLGLPLRLGVGNAGLWSAASLQPQRLTLHARGLRLDGSGLPPGDGPVRLDWHGEPAARWRLLRHPSRSGLRHTVLVSGADGRPLMALWPEGARDRPEPCAWRDVLHGLALAPEPRPRPRPGPGPRPAPWQESRHV